MPVPPKPRERRQRRNKRPEAGLVLAPVRELPELPVPDPPVGLLAATVRAWQSFWSSPLAGVVSPATDLAALERLFSLADERERALRAFRRERVVEGSKGQAVLNPLGRQLLAYDAEIRQLEDRFGLTPMARLRLGVQFGAAHRTLEDLNRALEEDDAHQDEPDPRLAVVQASAQPRR